MVLSLLSCQVTREMFAAESDMFLPNSANRREIQLWFYKK